MDLWGEHCRQKSEPVHRSQDRASPVCLKNRKEAGELKGSVQEAEWSRSESNSLELLELRMNVCALEWGRKQKEG